MLTCFGFAFANIYLQVEHEIDKKLGIKSRDDVTSIGIAAYNEACRSIVTRYTNEWEEVVNRMGRWIDFKNDYKTMEPWFMESVWWVFKTIFEKHLVYRSYKVRHSCSHTATQRIQTLKFDDSWSYFVMLMVDICSFCLFCLFCIVQVMPYSTACNTPLSNFEASLDYRQVNDPAVVVSFPLVDEPGVSLLAWTTTPWTLPSNMALCVNPTLKVRP